MARFLGIGERFPEYSLDACVSIEKGKEFRNIKNEDARGKWAVYFFWPLDFTFVCPTEIAEFNNQLKGFQDREAVLFGASCDSKFTHLAWRQHHPDLKNLGYPMLADYKKELCETLGILHNEAKAPLRATYIVDPQG